MVSPIVLKFVLGQTKTFANKQELAYQSEVDILKTSVSSGKATIAAAVTDKGVQTAADATFQQIANNIGQIDQGVNLLNIINRQYTKYYLAKVDSTGSVTINDDFAAMTELAACWLDGFDTVFDYSRTRLPEQNAIGDSIGIHTNIGYCYYVPYLSLPNRYYRYGGRYSSGMYGLWYSPLFSNGGPVVQSCVIYTPRSITLQGDEYDGSSYGTEAMPREGLWLIALR